MSKPPRSKKKKWKWSKADKAMDKWLAKSEPFKKYVRKVASKPKCP